MAASAHEFWLEPTAFDTSAGRPIGVYVCNGSGFEGWSLPRDSTRIEEFIAVGPDGSHLVVGHDGTEPAGLVRLTSPGGYVVVFRSNRAMTMQRDEKFDEYLQEKGLDEVLATRSKEGHHGGKVRESFSRYAKALVWVGQPPGRAAFTDRALGLPLEIVAENTSTFRVLYGGKPLPRALVTAMRPGTTDVGITARTATDGRVQFKLRDGGAWRISAVHMVAPSKDIDADWDSLWASLTFELPGTTAEAPVAEVPAHATRCLNQVAAPVVQARR
jgi:uncharacterized GH25 family protein